jgi:hypothetical protein
MFALKSQRPSWDTWAGRDFVALEEGWFCDHTDRERISPSGNEKAPGRERKMTTYPKTMLTVVRNLAGFNVVDVLPKGGKCCSAYCQSHIMDPLPVSLQPSPQHPFWKLVIHVDTLLSARQE